MSYQSFDQSSVQSMNRCTGPAPCQCPITGPHRDDNPYCSRNRRTAHIQSVPGGAAFLRVAAATNGVPCNDDRTEGPK